MWLKIYRVIKNYCRGFSNLSYALEIGVCSCIDGSRNSQSFLLWCAMCSSYAFLRLERNLLRWRRKAFCVLTFYECRSVTIVQRQFRTQFRKQPLSDNSIWRWYAQFPETGCVCKRRSTGRPSVTEEQVEQVRQAFIRSTRKPIARGNRELDIPQPTVWRILRKRLKLKLLSQEYCVWQVVKTPTIISNNPV